MIIEGYTILVKIAENGLTNRPDKVKSYMELFIKNYPNNDLCKPFKHLIAGDKTNLILLETDESSNRAKACKDQEIWRVCESWTKDYRCLKNCALFNVKP